MSTELARLLERIEEHGARVTLRNGALFVEQEDKLPSNLAFKLQAKTKDLTEYIHSTNSIHSTNFTNSAHPAVMGRKSERGEWGSGQSFTHRSPSKPLQNKLFSPTGERSERSERTLEGNAKNRLESERSRVNVHSEAIHPHSPRPCRFFVCPVCGERAASKDHEAVDCTCGEPMRLTAVEPLP